MDVDGFIKAFHELRLRCGFTVDETEEMMDVFDKFDQDLSGNISAEEFARVLKYMGFNPPDEMVAELIRLADSDQSGEIDKDEFPGAMRIYTELQTKQFRRVVWVANKRFVSSKFKFKYPRARNLEIIGLVLGCIEAKFCKKICVGIRIYLK